MICTASKAAKWKPKQILHLKNFERMMHHHFGNFLLIKHQLYQLYNMIRWVQEMYIKVLITTIFIRELDKFLQNA